MWALSHLVNDARPAVCEAVMAALPWDHFSTLLQDADSAVQVGLCHRCQVEHCRFLSRGQMQGGSKVMQLQLLCLRNLLLLGRLSDGQMQHFQSCHCLTLRHLGACRSLCDSAMQILHALLPCSHVLLSTFGQVARSLVDVHQGIC